MMTLLGDAYGRAMPFLLLVSVLQITGTLTVLVVMTAHDRPTVAQAIRRGFVMTGPYLLAQLLIGLTLGGAFVLFVSLMSLTGIQALAAAAVLMIFAVMVYCGLRVMLIAPSSPPRTCAIPWPRFAGAGRSRAATPRASGCS
jgi:hypothetical protein